VNTSKRNNAFRQYESDTRNDTFCFNQRNHKRNHWHTHVCEWKIRKRGCNENDKYTTRWQTQKRERSRNRNRNIRFNDMTKIVLKSLHNDIINANKKSTLTTKQMRVWLRTNMRDAMQHDKNSSWTFTQSQYDKVRSHFDATYKPNATKQKRVAKSKPEIVDANAWINN